MNRPRAISLKLLLVDDNERNLMALSEALRREDVDVLCAKSGLEALELLLTHGVALAIIDVGEAGNGDEAVAQVKRLRPDVVVMDINMPKMNGIEATRTIKMDHPKMVVIGISVNAVGENRTRMLEAGAATLLTKEAAVEQLYDVIQKAVKKGREHTRL